MPILSGRNAVSSYQRGDVEVLKNYAVQMLKNTGHEEISLSSLSSSDYSQLKELVTFLIDEFHGKGINISFRLFES